MEVYDVLQDLYVCPHPFGASDDFLVVFGEDGVVLVLENIVVFFVFQNYFPTFG